MSSTDKNILQFAQQIATHGPRKQRGSGEQIASHYNHCIWPKNIIFSPRTQIIDDNMNYNFEWDTNKEKSNKRKHGVSFEEAATVFRDSLAITIFDPDHSESENRWITLGISKNGKLLVTCHTFQAENGSAIIRIFSSRKATTTEKKQYGE